MNIITKLFYPIIFYSALAFSQENPDLKFEKITENNDIVIYVTNSEVSPISLEFDYAGENINSTLAPKSIIVIPANAKKFEISRMKAQNKQKSYKFNYDVSYVWGDVNIKNINTEYNYWLPYSQNTSESIYQGYNGTFSHQNAYSLDFSHKIGTKIFAAREGVVIFTKSSEDKSCLSKDCSKYNNQIIIMHDDGSFAEYVHLKKDGVIVKKGDIINKGQLIGYSGNTGWSKGPHLHFSVFTNKIDGERNYYKTKFRVKGSNQTIYLQEKKSYTRDY